MKAASAVLVQVQRQMTIFGLPPRLLILAVLAGTVCAVGGIAADILVLFLIGFVGGFAASWVWLVRRYRADLHFDRHLTVAPKFWIKGKGGRRCLVAGGRA